eukprot:ctg_362.g245
MTPALSPLAFILISLFTASTAPSHRLGNRTSGHGGTTQHRTNQQHLRVIDAVHRRRAKTARAHLTRAGHQRHAWTEMAAAADQHRHLERVGRRRGHSARHCRAGCRYHGAHVAAAERRHRGGGGGRQGRRRRRKSSLRGGQRWRRRSRGGRKSGAKWRFCRHAGVGILRQRHRGGGRTDGDRLRPRLRASERRLSQSGRPHPIRYCHTQRTHEEEHKYQQQLVGPLPC